MTTIVVHHIGGNDYLVSDDGGLCGDPEVVALGHSAAMAAAEQRERLYSQPGRSGAFPIVETP